MYDMFTKKIIGTILEKIAEKYKFSKVARTSSASNFELYFKTLFVLHVNI